MASADDQTVQVSFGAVTDGFTSGVHQAATAVKTAGVSFRETGLDAVKLDEALTKVVSRLDPAYKASTQLANGISLLDRNLQAGNISAQTHAAMMQKLEASYGQVAEGARQSSFATAGVSRELIVMGHEVMTGNFSRIPGTMMVLASRTGNLGAIFAALASPVGLATLAIGGLAAVMAYLGTKAAEAEKHMQALQDNMTATGRTGVYSRQMLDALAETLHKTGDISKSAAQSIIDVFVRTHQIGGPLMTELVGIVGKFANATGKDAVEAAKELAKAFADPMRGAKELDGQLNLLTSDQIRLIQQQMEQGHTSQAQSILLEALKARMQGVGDATKYAADQMERERALEQGVSLPDKGPGTGVQSQSSLGAAEYDKVRDAVKETLEATKHLQGVDEKRTQLQNELTGLQEAQKVATASEASILEGRVLEVKKKIADLDKPKGGASPLEAMKQQLQQLHDAEQDTMNQDRALDVQFWASKVNTAKQGTALRAQIDREYASAKRALEMQTLGDDVATIKADAAKYREGSQERVQAAQDAARLIGATYGQESKQYKNAEREIEAAMRARIQQQRQMNEQGIDAQLQHSKTVNDIERDSLNFQQSMGQITAQEKIAALRELEQREYQMERQALDDKLHLEGVEPQERQKIDDQIEQLEATHQRKMVKLNQDAALDSQHRWTSFWQPVGAAWSSGIAGLIMCTTTLRQAMVSVTAAMLQSFINMAGEMLATWIMKTAAMQAVKQAFGINVTATDATNAATAVVAAKTEAAGVIPAYASEAATGAMASVAAIPFVGWAMAPGVGAEQFALSMSYMIPSAAGGWEVPRDTLAMVHEQEMILPASISNHIRASMSGGSASDGGSGGDTHVHLNVAAMDGQSVAKFFRDNRTHLSKQITTSVRDAGLRMKK